MTNNQAYIQHLLNTVWPEWRITGLLGKGSYGSVYEIIRDDLGSGYKCALKVLQMYAPSAGDLQAGTGSVLQQEETISLGIGRELSGSAPQPVYNSQPYDHAPRGKGYSGERAPYSGQNTGEQTLDDFVRSVSAEIDMMMQLKGAPGIVSIEDYAVLKDTACRIFLIRMEELESIDHYFRRTGYVDRRDVLRLGMDICTALSFCERGNIIHRDIKPGNLFYSEKAGFKLGDFGISRKMASVNEMMSMSGVGTFQYMAPEVYRGEKYNHTVDIYSLGLVLYTLLNGNNPPFCFTNSSTGGSLQGERHAALMRRLGGEKLPPPAFCDAGLGALICKACDPNPAKRFQTAADFYNALKNCYEDKGGNTSDGNKRKKFLFAAAAAVVLAFLLIGVLSRHPDRPSPKRAYTVIPETPSDPDPDNTGSGSDSTGSDSVGGTGTESDNIDTDTPEEVPVPATVSYTVLYKNQETGIDLYTQETGSAKAGDSISLSAREIEGYTPVEAVKTITLSESSEDNICIFEYKKIPVSIVYNTKGEISILCKKYESEKMQRLIDRFSHESGIRITAQVVGTGSYSSKMEERITGSSDDPTIFMLSGFKDWEKYGFECLDLTECAAAQEISEEDLVLRGSDSRIYGIPCIEECWGLVVNTRLLEKAGYQVSDIRCFDDLKNIAEDITSRKSELGFSAFTSPSISVSSHGSYRLSEHAPSVPLYYELKDHGFQIGTRLTGSYMDRFKAYIDLNIDNSVVPRSEAVNRSLDDSRQELLSGKAVFHQDGSWYAENLQNSLKGDAAIIPMYMGMPGEENQGLNITCSYFWCVNKNASPDDREAALQFLQWLTTSDEAIRIMTEDMGFALPYKRANAPDNFMIETLLDEKANGITPVQQYYKYGKYTSWINGLNNAVEKYITGTGGWDSVKTAFTKLW